MNNHQDENIIIILSEIENKRTDLENYLKKIDKIVYDLETNYFENTQNCGNIIKGWEHYFCAKPKVNVGLSLKKTKFSVNERIFSLSSFNNSYLNEDYLNILEDEESKILYNPIITSNPCPILSKKKKIISLKRKKSNADLNKGSMNMNTIKSSIIKIVNGSILDIN